MDRTTIQPRRYRLWALGASGTLMLLALGAAPAAGTGSGSTEPLKSPQSPAAEAKATWAPGDGKPPWTGEGKPSSQPGHEPAPHFVDCAAPVAGEGTKATPWNSLDQVATHTFGPGDKLLFKRGTTCTGTLQTVGSGSAESSFKIASYGDSTERAVLDGNGRYTVIHLFNQEHVTIEGLEIINAASPGTNRRGITVQLEDFGTGSGYVLRDIYMHHIVGDDAEGPAGSQGIVFQITGTDVPTKFNDVQLLNNRLHHINRQAVNIQLSTWRCRPEIGCAGKDNWLGATNVVVRGNHLTDIGGDGIVMNTTDSALVENNTLEGFNVRSDGYNAGIWSYNTNNTLVQFNDVSRGKGTMDGMAYDIDGGNINNIFQYNLSHDNEGGFFLLCNQPTNPGGSNANPLLCNPGGATNLSDTGGYRLQLGSPAIDSGLTIADNGGRDFFGVDISEPSNIGAAEIVGCN